MYLPVDLGHSEIGRPLITTSEWWTLCRLSFNLSVVFVAEYKTGLKFFSQLNWLLGSLEKEEQVDWQLFTFKSAHVVGPLRTY